MAISQLKHALNTSGYPIDQFGQAELLARTPAAKFEELNAAGQADAALIEIASVLEEFDAATDEGRPD